MDVEQKYIEGKKYELDDFFIENLQEIPFALEIVRTVGDNPILSDIELISMDEYLDLMNLNLYIKSNERSKDRRTKRNS